MKPVRYTVSAAKDLKRYGTMAARIRRAMDEFAATGAHSNNVTQLVGLAGWRMRVGDFRVIFDDGRDEIVVTKIGPRGDVYD